MVHVNKLASLGPLKVKCSFGDCVLHNDEGTIVMHHSLPLCMIEVKLKPLEYTVLSVLDLGSKIIVMPKHIWEDIRLPVMVPSQGHHFSMDLLIFLSLI